MIYSDKQYGVSSAQLAKLQDALAAAKARTSDQVWLKQAEIDGLKSQIADIEAELAEYDLLKSGQASFSKTYALEELPRVLVQARIASGMSQTDLAEKLGMKPQQVQRYEATDYMGASLGRLIEISKALGVKASGSFEGPKQAGGSVFAWGDADDIVWGQLPYKEMIKRKWFDLPRGANPIERVKEYFLHAAGPQFATAFHRKKMRSGNVPNEYALLAWQARILERARSKIEAEEIGTFELDDRWLPELVHLTKRKDGPKRARDLLADKGIVLIVERHLSGSYLDGAAMFTDGDTPVVGLTLRYDRLDNFWFVLMHELGHVFLHLFDGLRFDFFDEEGGNDGDAIEAEADKFALDALIPEALWDQCLSRFALSEEAVKIDAETIGIDPSIIAGRIRKERGNYTILNDLVGRDQVRSQLEEASDDLD
ncbi:XRE family transcriptional regulator [Mesorhizobium sp.]|uniref:XRE family transcriptional regulator n=1 Tax=Mesorhizobium sp. TaxID=1871066 RepID=UPI0011F60E14|nr:XRE family transcriptional regulator [Mesorhizobium sp.]TIO05686.1 MAG: helix-turn-helix domain-containing protein [Mesorhizobium sp.]TIO33081.1 MAG: helix-turn-helix domain-containing protein [Mesorhizobium sp.]